MNTDETTTETKPAAFMPAFEKNYLDIARAVYDKMLEHADILDELGWHTNGLHQGGLLLIQLFPAGNRYASENTPEAKRIARAFGGAWHRAPYAEGGFKFEGRVKISGVAFPLQLILHYAEPATVNDVLSLDA